MLSGIARLSQFDLENQRVLVRADFDFPAKKDGQPLENGALEKLVPTLLELDRAGARTIVCGRHGDPKREGQKSGPAPSLLTIAERLAELTKLEVHLPDAATGDAVRKVIDGLKTGRLCVLENLSNEEDMGNGAEAFARVLAGHTDVFVADSLRALTLDSATTTILPRLVDRKCAGEGLMAELGAFARLRSQVDRPRVLVWGGNSLKGNIEELYAQATIADHVFLAGVPANTVLAALGHDMGKSAIEEDFLAGARTLHEKLGDKLTLPVDLMAGASPRSESGDVRSPGALGGQMALDIGPRSREAIARKVDQAHAVVWSGSLGFARNTAFSGGTRSLVEALASSRAFTVVVQDDSVAAARAVAPEAANRLSCVSDGGLASLRLLSDKKLIGLEALRGTST
jgi:phosphoglycerate kinase